MAKCKTKAQERARLLGLEKVQLTKDSFKKTLAFDFYSIPTDISHIILTTTMKKRYVDILKKIIPAKNVLESILGGLDNRNKSKWLFADILNKYSNRQLTEKEKAVQHLSIVNRAIAFKHIISSIKMQADIIAKTPGAKIEDILDGNGVQVHASMVYLAIGRDIALALGVRPKKVGGKLENAFYTEIGKIQVEKLAEIKRNGKQLLTINKNGATIINDFYTNGEKEKGEGHNILKTETITFNPEAFPETDAETTISQLMLGSSDLLSGSEELKGSMSFTSAMAKMYAPRFAHLPLNKKEDTGTQQVNTDGSFNIAPTPKEQEQLSDEQKKAANVWHDTLKELAQGSMFVDDDILSILTELKTALEEISEIDDGARIRKLATKLDLSIDEMHKIFGTFYNKFSVKDTIASDWGQALSKEIPIMNTITALDKIKTTDGRSKKLMQEIIVYQTARFMYKSNILNEQTDKPFSREVTFGNPVSYKIGSKQFNIFVAGLSTNFGISIEEILNGTNPKIEEAIARFNKDKKEGKNLLHTLADLSDLNIGTSPWSTLMFIKTLSQIREGQNSKEGIVTSAMTIEVDAKASGPTIATLQSFFGDNTSPQYEIMTRLGIFGNKENTEDFYKLLDAKLEKSRNTIANAKIQELVDLGLFKNRRDIMKPITMVIGYMAGEKTAINSASSELLSTMYKSINKGQASKETVAFLKQKIKEYGGKDLFIQIGRMTNAEKIIEIPGIHAALLSYLNKEISEEMDKQAREMLKEFLGKREKALGRFAETIKESAKLLGIKNPTIIPYLTRILLSDVNHPDHNKHEIGTTEWRRKERQNLKKYGIPLTSKRISLQEGFGLDEIVTTERIFNGITLVVNATHAIDAGQFLLAHKNTIARMKEMIKEADPFMKKQLQSSLDSHKKLLHDGNGADAYYTEIFQEEYAKQTIEAHKAYSVELEAAKVALALMDETTTEKGDIAAALEEVKKQELLLKSRANFLEKNPPDTTKTAEIFSNENLDTELKATDGTPSPTKNRVNTDYLNKNKNNKQRLKEAIEQNRAAYIDLEYSFEENEKGEKEIYQISAKNSKGETFELRLYPDGKEGGLTADKYNEQRKEGYLTAEDLKKNASPYTKEAIEEGLLQLQKFLGDDVLVAYNGFNADFEIMAQHKNGQSILQENELVDAYSARMEGKEKGKKGENTQGAVAGENLFDLEQTKLHDAAQDVETLEKIAKPIAEISFDSQLARQTMIKAIKAMGINNAFVRSIINDIKFGQKNTQFLVPEKTIHLRDDVTTEEAQHELYHAITIDYLSTMQDLKTKTPEYIKIEKAYKFVKANLKNLQKQFKNDPIILAALTHIAKANELEGIAEMAAIAATSEKFRNAIKSKTFTEAIKAFFTEVLQKLFGNPDTILNQELLDAVDSLLEKAIQREQNPSMEKELSEKRTAEKIQKLNAVPKGTAQEKKFEEEMSWDWTPDDAVSFPGESFVAKSVLSLNTYTRAVLINTTIENKQVKQYLAKGIMNLDASLAKKSLLYCENAKRAKALWKTSPRLNALKSHMFPERTGDRYFFNKLITAVKNAEKHAKQIDDQYISKINGLLEGFTDEQKSHVFFASTTVPLFHLLQDENTLLKDIVKSKDKRTTISNMINDLTEKSGLAKTHLLQISELAKLLARKNKINAKKGIKQIYNLKQLGLTEHTLPFAQKILALEVIMQEERAIKGLELFNSNPELFAEIAHMSIAIKTTHDRIFADDSNNKMFKENLINDLLSSPMEIVAVTAEDMMGFQYKKEKGWKLLRKPSKTEYGIVYRAAKDKTSQPGIGTSLSYNFADITVPKEKFFGPQQNYVTVYDRNAQARRKLILTEEEINKIGQITNPADALVRTLSQLVELEETSSARKALVASRFNRKITSKLDGGNFAKEVTKQRIEEVPWIVSFKTKAEAVNFYEKHPEIHYLYSIADNVTQYNRTNEKIHLVRSDIKDQLIGYEDIVAFKDNVFFRNAMYVVRQLVKMSKLHMTVLNPAKIAGDLISNVAILMAKGVSPTFVMRHFKRTGELQRQITDLQIELINLILEKNTTKNEALQTKIDKVKEKIRKHPYGMLLMEGMIQSISTEIMEKDTTVIAGVQKDFETVINKLLALETSSGKTEINTAIAGLIKSGINIDQILKAIGEKGENITILKELGKKLKDAGLNLEKIKKSGNVAKYITEFMGTPESGIVRFGASLVEGIDIASRYILMQHHLANGMNKKKAVADVLDSFIDYKVNMPREMKYLSDMGILLFPSFWVRIQRVAYKLAIQNPATAVLGLSLESLLQLNLPTIYDSTIIAKDHFVYLPPIDEGSFLPNHIFDFIPH